MADNRFRLWSFLTYEEWNIKDLYNTLCSMQVKGFMSPVHNLDLNKEGQPVKPHRHIYLVFSGKKSYDNVLDLVKGFIPQVSIVKKMDDIGGCWNYSIHRENNNKVKYDSADRLTFNGFDIADENKFSTSEEEAIIDDILAFVEAVHCFEFSHLVLWSRLHNKDWYRVIRSNTYFFKVFMDSFRGSISYYDDKLKCYVEKSSYDLSYMDVEGL